MRRILLTVLSALALVATGVVAGFAAGGTGTVDPPPRIAFLANGIVPADALAAGGIAGQLGAPLFTTRADSLNDDARDGITAYDPDLVIVLGGPVAINDSVVTALAAATGLAVTTADDPEDGIVRVAGEDRFATARAVAGLLAAYNPAYLPTDATALGALDSDTLDGLDSTAFQPAGDYALADQACTAGQVVTGTATDGTPTCATDNVDGGDADTLDGLDSAAFLTAADTAALLPIARFTVADDVIVTSAFRAPVTGSPTISHPTTGRYDIDLPGVSFSITDEGAVCSRSDLDGGEVNIDSAGDLVLWVTNAAGTLEDPFTLSCVVYDGDGARRATPAPNGLTDEQSQDRSALE